MVKANFIFGFNIGLTTLLRRCHVFNSILSVSCNNKNKLLGTLQFPLSKGTFN